MTKKKNEVKIGNIIFKTYKSFWICRKCEPHCTAIIRCLSIPSNRNHRSEEPLYCLTMKEKIPLWKFSKVEEEDDA